MADSVLQFSRQFGKGAIVAFWDEERIITEASVAIFCCGYTATNDAFDLRDFAITDERYDRAETGVAVRLAGKLLKGFLAVVGWVGRFTRPACCSYAGQVAECFNLQAGIVSKAVAMIVVIDELRFDERVAFERISRLGDISVTANVLEAEDFVLGQDGTNLLEFVGVIGCKDEFHCCIYQSNMGIYQPSMADALFVSKRWRRLLVRQRVCRLPCNGLLPAYVQGAGQEECSG